MTVFVTVLLVLLTLAASTALCVGSMLFAESMWRRSASADIIRNAEALLRAHAT
jgi:hypothetical protein